MAAITRSTCIRSKRQNKLSLFLFSSAVCFGQANINLPNAGAEVGVYAGFPTPVPGSSETLDLTSAFDSTRNFDPQTLARWDAVLEKRVFPGIAAIAARQGPVTHILAREQSAAALHKSLWEGRVYVADEALASSKGFVFIASNNLGIYQMGDTIPLFMDARFTAVVPRAAKLKLIHNGKIVAQSDGAKLEFSTKETGYYRLEAWLEVEGKPRPWIYANPIFVSATSGLRLPPSQIPDNVEARRDVEYVAGSSEDAAKHKLDIYTPKGKKNLPVFVFIHGGSWRQGDRSQYVALGSRLAQDGIAVVIPSYRLAPKNQHPAQIDDVRAAFRWTVAHLAEFGGDPARIYVGGHSAGGHLAAMLGLTEPGIKGVAALSGVYDVTGIQNVFTDDPGVRRQASPMTHVKPGAPEFTVTYCQWDYHTLPQQAEKFAMALKEAGVKVTLVYVEGESHISEIINTVKDLDKTHQAILDLVR